MVAMPAQWSTPATETGGPIEPVTEEWWRTFADPELDSLVTRAVAANLDLRLATARLAEARAARGVAKSGLLPQVNGSVTATREQQITQGFVPDRTGGSGSLQTLSYDTNLYGVLADMSWEIDVFGRLRRQLEAATGDVVAQQEDRRNVLITLLGDVATNYFQVRSYQQRLEIANRNVAMQEDTVRLTRDLRDAGEGTEREVAQAETLLETTRAAVFGLDTGLKTTLHRLGVLLGEQPDAVEEELRDSRPLPPTPPSVPAGLPSELLTRRPDIRRAEAQLAAATARVGQAKADYFPTFSLTGSAGREATELHQLTIGAANLFAIGPSVSIPIFSGGKIRSNVAVREAQVDEGLATYESTILGALEETENALTTNINEQARRERLRAVVRSSETAFTLAQVQYRAGLADFLTVLDAERTLATNQDLLAQSSLATATAVISLYKALGGGWTVSP
jgi:NodT family efflux transporter outer membrane factor (OMF) lipoprotein